MCPFLLDAALSLSSTWELKNPGVLLFVSGEYVLDSLILYAPHMYFKTMVV